MDKKEYYKYLPEWVIINMKNINIKPSTADYIEESFYRNAIKMINNKYFEFKQ